MAKEKAPVFKTIDHYNSIVTEENPFVTIGDLIEDHNWEYQFDRVTKDFKKIPTKKTYLMCNGCPSCRKITKKRKMITDWKVSQIVTKPLNEWSVKEVLSLISKRYTIRELSKVSGVGSPQDFIEAVAPLFSDDKGMRSLLFYNIPYKIIKLLTGISEEEYKEIKQDYDSEWEIGKLDFLEKVGV